MTEGPERLRLARQWIEMAEHDLITADHTLSLRENCPFDTVCFHAHQCVEKYLKSYLVFAEVEFPKTHDLVILLKLSDTAGLAGLEIGEIQPLNRYSIEARYPGDWEPIEGVEARRAVEVARRVRQIVRTTLGDETIHP